MTACIDYKRAIVATEQEMLRIIHALLRKDKPYEDPNIDYQKLVVKQRSALALDAEQARIAAGTASQVQQPGPGTATPQPAPAFARGC